MPKFAVRCIQPVTGKPYTLAIRAASYESAARAASAHHTIDPSDFPPAQTFLLHDPADRVIRIAFWIVVTLFVGIPFLVVSLALLSDVLSRK